MLKRIILGSVIPDTQEKEAEVPRPTWTTNFVSETRQIEDSVFDLKIHCKAAESKQHGAGAWLDTQVSEEESRVQTCNTLM